jgi:hypothetical protein
MLAQGEPICWIVAQPAREDLSRKELLDHTQAGTAALEGLKEQTHGGLHLCVRVGDDAVPSIMYEADRRVLLEFSAAGTTPDAAAQSCPSG